MSESQKWRKGSSGPEGRTKVFWLEVPAPEQETALFGPVEVRMPEWLVDVIVRDHELAQDFEKGGPFKAVEEHQARKAAEVAANMEQGRAERAEADAARDHELAQDYQDFPGVRAASDRMKAAEADAARWREVAESALGPQDAKEAYDILERQNEEAPSSKA